MSIVALLAVLMTIAFGLRAAGFERVFPAPGEIVLAVGDASFHARLALFATMRFPEALLWDTYLAFPEGASVPSPPLFDWSAAAAARALGGAESDVERVLAWVSPILGTAAVLVVFAAGRSLSGVWTSLGAAALYALFPAAVFAAQVGNSDHHAAVALLGAGLLAMTLRMATRDPEAVFWSRDAVGLAMLRGAMILTWAGSLLYVFLLDGSLFLVWILTGRRAVLCRAGASLLLTTALILPFVLILPEPMGGLYSAVALSRLHPLVLAGGAAVAVLSGVLVRLRPAQGPLLRSAYLLSAACGVGLLMLLIPSIRAGVLEACRFLTLGDSLGQLVWEQAPLLSWGDRQAAFPPWHKFGWLSYAVPLTPLAALVPVREQRTRAAAVVLAFWCAVLALLALSQSRYSNDFAVSGAIAFALGFAAMVRGLAAWTGRRALAVGLVMLAVGLALWPALSSIHGPRIRTTLRVLAGGEVYETPQRSLRRFALQVRRVTPPTSGFLDPTESPEYGVLSGMNLGHSLRYWARRPVVVDGLADYIAPHLFQVAGEVLTARDEDVAFQAARKLRVRYLVTGAAPGMMRNEGIPALLHRRDGRAGLDAPRLEHFRLVTEGPKGGLPLATLYAGRPPRAVVPYKLFEIVEGAILEVPGAPGTRVTATIALVTPLGRTFSYDAVSEIGLDGVARLRVPYGTEPGSPVRPSGPYRIAVGTEQRSVRVSMEAVRRGSVVPVR